MALEFMSESEKKDFARLHIRRYFLSSDIPDEKITEERYLKICINTDICSGMQMAYRAMEESGRFVENSDISHPIEKDVRFVIKMLERMSKTVPQELSAGILLMHLELVEGIPITETTSCLPEQPAASIL